MLHLRYPRYTPACLEDTFKTFPEDILKTCLVDVLKTSLNDVLKTRQYSSYYEIEAAFLF